MLQFGMSYPLHSRQRKRQREKNKTAMKRWGKALVKNTEKRIFQKENENQYQNLHFTFAFHILTKKISTKMRKK